MNTAPSSQQVPASEARGQSLSATNLPLVQESAANQEVQQLFAHYRSRFARAEVPGIVRCFATNTAMLKGMLEIAENFLFTESLLERRLKEMIATYISRQNICPYCADSHGAMLRSQGGSPAELDALQSGTLDLSLFTAAEIALLTFAGKLNTESSAITRGDVETLLRAGWTEAQVAEAVHITALFAAFNRIANGFGLSSPFPDGPSHAWCTP